MKRSITRARNFFALKAVKFGSSLTLLGATLTLRKTPRRILIDTSILGHAVYMETYKVVTGVSTWGGKEFEEGRWSSIPVHSIDNSSDLFAEIKYLATISELIKLGRLTAYTSMELELEKWRQPQGRFEGYSIFDKSFFSGIRLQSIDGFAFHPTETLEAQVSRIVSKTDVNFQSLLSFFNTKTSLDVWHLYTAEKYGLDCFLTLDFKFVKQFKKSEKRSNFPKLKSRPMLPSEFGKMIGAGPMPPVVMQLTEKGFRAELRHSSPTQRREKPKLPRK